MLSATCQSGSCHKYGHQYRWRSHFTAIGPSSSLQLWLRLRSLRRKFESWQIARSGRCQLSCPAWMVLGPVVVSTFSRLRCPGGHG
eukprot:3027252-Lingulodinium_polyedra.AAC.1